MTDEQNRSAETTESEERRILNRRAFITASTAAVAGAGVAGFAVGRHTDLFRASSSEAGSTTNDTSVTSSTASQYPDVPETPHTIPDSTILTFFTVHEAATVDALTSRILPGTPEDPGAHEAGVVTYIDNVLAIREGLPEPTYLAGPFAVTTDETDLTATPSASPEAQTIVISSDQIQRYGYQSQMTPADVYRIGIAALDRYTTAALGNAFIDLNSDQQDQVIGDLANGKIDPFDANLTGASFFKNLRNHTAEGMFSDPVYGGNRNLVGWTLIGHPGAQRAYSPSDIRNPSFSRAPQSIVDMMAQMPGMADNDNAVLPINGSDEEHSNEP